jgi:hypothetical protein
MLSATADVLSYGKALGRVSMTVRLIAVNEARVGAYSERILDASKT